MAADTVDLDLTSAYQLVGAGPGFISMTGFLAEIRFDAGGVPASNLPGHKFIRDGIIAYEYPGTLNIYAKKPDTDNKDVIVVYTEL